MELLPNDFVSGFVNEIYSTQCHWMVQDELKEAATMYSTIRVDTRWHEERPFYTQKAAGLNPASSTLNSIISTVLMVSRAY